MTVGYELEVTALRKNGGSVTYRAILETDEQTGGEPIAADDLEEVTHREDVALFRTQREKAVDGFLDMAHLYRLCWRTGLKNTDQHGGGLSRSAPKACISRAIQEG